MVGTPPRRVAVSGGDSAVRDALADAGLEQVPAETAETLVTVGESPLLSLAADPPDVPVLPVDGVRGPLSVPRDALADAFASLAAGETRRLAAPVLEVKIAGDVAGRALADVTLVTTEPAHISEYAVHVHGGRLAEVRSDGVVAATPLGSGGYARAAGGSVLLPDTGIVVVPISPFVTDADDWVVPPEIEFTVEREGDEVSLVLDDAVWDTVAPGESVRVSRVADLPIHYAPGLGR